MEARAEERIQEKANREANKRKFRNLEWEDIKTAFRQGKSWKETAERLDLPKGYATELAKSLKEKGPDYYYEAYNTIAENAGLDIRKVGS